MDYVAAWFKKASEHMKDSSTKAAFVSTNSVTQGQQAITLWRPLFKGGVSIFFAHRTFRWSNEARNKAAVHCVIIGFSYDQSRKRHIHDGASKREVSHINSYLSELPDTSLESRPNPLCDVPHMFFGSMPRDGGGFILNEEEMTMLIKREPLAKKWVRRYVGSKEYIRAEPRWCLWLVNAAPNEIQKCPTVLQRIEAVRRFRSASKAEATRRFAGTPTLFCQIAQPDCDYLVVPGVSSEKREYVPMGFLDKDTIASNLVHIIPAATLYHFGVLTSSVHMAWTRAVCGRLEMRYRYSKDIVYNNFPWPGTTDKQRNEVERLAQAVLDARAEHPESSLADLYDPLTMSPNLLKAHEKLDRVVMKLYGFAKDAAEHAIVAELMGLYSKLVTTERR
jgi:hypothetical protein